jgi:hypothetical protein
MEKENTKQQTAQDRDRAEPQRQSTEPRGNPETDHESVKKGEEQLHKVSGN